MSWRVSYVHWLSSVISIFCFSHAAQCVNIIYSAHVHLGHWLQSFMYVWCTPLKCWKYRIILWKLSKNVLGMFLNKAITSVLQCVQPTRTYHRHKNGLLLIEPRLTTPGTDILVIWSISKVFVYYSVTSSESASQVWLMRHSNTRTVLPNSYP